MTTFSFSKRTEPSPRKPKRYRSDLALGHGYRCPQCRETMSTIDSRRTDEGFVRRRRECPGCKHRLTTMESPELVEAKKEDVAESRILRRLRAIRDMINDLGEGEAP